MLGGFGFGGRDPFDDPFFRGGFRSDPFSQMSSMMADMDRMHAHMHAQMHPQMLGGGSMPGGAAGLLAIAPARAPRGAARTQGFQDQDHHRSAAQRGVHGAQHQHALHVGGFDFGGFDDFAGGGVGGRGGPMMRSQTTVMTSHVTPDGHRVTRTAKRDVMPDGTVHEDDDEVIEQLPGATRRQPSGRAIADSVPRTTNAASMGRDDFRSATTRPRSLHGGQGYQDHHIQHQDRRHRDRHGQSQSATFAPRRGVEVEDPLYDALRSSYVPDPQVERRAPQRRTPSYATSVDSTSPRGLSYGHHAHQGQRHRGHGDRAVPTHTAARPRVAEPDDESSTSAPGRGARGRSHSDRWTHDRQPTTPSMQTYVANSRPGLPTVEEIDE